MKTEANIKSSEREKTTAETQNKKGSKVNNVGNILCI